MALSMPLSIATSAAAACAACVFTNPMEVVKTRLQLDGEGRAARQYRGIAHALSSMWRLEGVRGVQAGLLPALCYQMAMNGTRLGLYEPAQRALVGATGADPASTPLKAAAAAMSGAVGATLGSPLYLIKSRLQAQSAHFVAKEAHAYGGLWDGLRSVHAAEGVRGLFRGLDGALPRVMAGSAVQLSSYDACKAHAAALGVAPGTPQHLAASLAASVLTVTVMNPLDVISTRLYQSHGKNTVYAGPLDCALQTVRAEGVAALQKGWLAQYGRLGPHTVLTFLFLEQLRPLVARLAAA
jgi:solute carrier family 25 protein 34/35